MGIEVPENERVITRGKEIPDGRSETWGAGGDWGNVNVVYVEGVIVDGDGDSQMLSHKVVAEERVSVNEGVLDGVVDKNYETPPARGARAVSSDGGVVGKRKKFRASGQPSLLNTGDQYIF